ncbi:hypothetical protein SVA_0827 [Sulfurifustis variabilis]|uniref:Carboxypeptidase regulatory-like domain-containing protein n=2 Tax=Sulfurifustis variabilis TaxID=1675686 RepID=A0A1B4V1P1_9GAMM|nr:hypothetical protein SVA_0827 [Sulfurifustis variabilis]
MRAAIDMKRLFRRCAVAAALTAIAGCGSSNSTPPERPSGAIEGIVFAAPVSGATVQAWTYRDGGRGELLGQATTDASGRYALSVKTPDGILLLEASGGVYREEASARDVTLAPQPHLRSLVRYVNGGPPPAGNITSFTTLASGLADHLVSGGETAQAATDRGFAAFNAALGLDVRAVTPLHITDPGSATGGLSPGHEYGFYEAAISQWTAEAGTRNGQTPHTTHTSASFVALGLEDIRADGLLDGSAEGGRLLSVGGIALDTETYRHDLAVALLRIAQSGANATGLAAGQLVPAADRWNGSTAGFFGYAPVVPLDETPPAITNLQPPENSILCGTFTASASVGDALLADSVFLLDGNLLGNQGTASAPRIAINTRQYSNGNHALVLRATDVLGNVSTLTRTLAFLNAFIC